MKKINNNGFVLAETLVVTVFVMTIFTLLYVNFYPLLGEYAKREFYDDIDSKYDAYWFKRMIQNEIIFSNQTFLNKTNEITNNHYAEITCNDFENNYKNMCEEYTNLIVASNKSTNKPMIRILLTDYQIGIDNRTDTFKGMMKQDSQSNNPKFSSALQEYVFYLPNYKNPSLNGARYRIIIEFRRKIDINSDSSDENLYYTFSTIEVLRQ